MSKMTIKLSSPSLVFSGEAIHRLDLQQPLLYCYTMKTLVGLIPEVKAIFTKVERISRMETIAEPGREAEYGKEGNKVGDYRDAVRQLIEKEMKSVVDEEMRKAAEELLEEQRKAIRQVLEEQKKTIREVVEEEKKAVWGRLEELRDSVSKLGLG